MIEASFLKNKYKPEEIESIKNLQVKLKENFPDENGLLVDSIDIARIVIGLKLDAKSVCAALIFPFVKNRLIAIDNLKGGKVVTEKNTDKNTDKTAEKSSEDDAENKIEIKHFEEMQDKEINGLIQMLMMCEKLSTNYSDADGLKEMLLAITKDIRVIIIKSAEVLIFARKNVKNYANEQTIKIFKSIDDLFAPIAARLGLSEIKSEFQDLSFEFHEPYLYYKLEEDVKNEARSNVQLLNKVVAETKRLVVNGGIDCKCYGRVKHLSSIQNKIKSKKCTIKGIYDIAAIRILVESVSECYLVLGIIHANYTPVDGRFKDYIANPKPNGYKSLHTTVYFDNEFFEIQIRTHAMHEFAEYGVAAHFLYKEHKRSLASLDNKLLWIRKLLENKESVSNDRLLEELKTDVYLGEIFVQTPRGKVIKLLENATPIDFAYAIHTDIGHNCTGAKVNGIMVPLSSTLSNSDVVEIITSPTTKAPSRDWLKIVKMQSTKDKINYFYKKQMKEENIKLGKVMVEQYAKSEEVSLASIMKEEWIATILRKNAFLNLDEMYAAIGYGSITAEKFVNRLLNIKRAEEQKNKNILDEIQKTPVKVERNTDIIGAEGTLTKYCKCCNPIPGDDIVGYVSRGRGIIIHKKSCENISKLPESRFIKVDWNYNEKEDLMFSSVVEVVAKNSNNVYLEITNMLSGLGVKLTSLNTSHNKNKELVLRIGILVKDKNQLLQVKNKLSSLGSVYEVK